MLALENKEFIEISSEISSLVSSSLPIVGMVVTISPSFNLYRIVVLPAASKPTVKKNEENIKHIFNILANNQNLPIKMRICFLPKSLVNKLEIVKPMSCQGENSANHCCKKLENIMISQVNLR